MDDARAEEARAEEARVEDARVEDARTEEVDVDGLDRDDRKDGRRKLPGEGRTPGRGIAPKPGAEVRGMKLLSSFRRRRASERPGSAPAIEAALRARRARDHLARKRRSDRRHEGRPARPRASSPARTALPVQPLPRGLAGSLALAAAFAGFASALPLFERYWLPRVPLARVAVVGSSVRQPETIARRLLGRAGAPISQVRADQVASILTSDPWIESAASFRLPDGTLLVRVVERRAVARYRPSPESEISLVDPTGLLFPGVVTAAGPLPLVTGPLAPSDAEAAALRSDDEAEALTESDAIAAPELAPMALEILAELSRHTELARDPAALTLHLPGAAGDGGAAKASADRLEATAETGFVLEIGRSGPRVLLGQSFLKRRIARLAALLDQRDALVAGANVIDLRYADRAVLRTEETEPTSG